MLVNTFIGITLIQFIYESIEACATVSVDMTTQCDKIEKMS